MKAPTAMGLAVALGLAACETNTKTTEELRFPLGVHTWSKSSDNRVDPPDDACTGCPRISLTEPIMSGLEAAGWRLTLGAGATKQIFAGTISQYGTNDCGANNNLGCSNEWRIWPPNSGDGAVNQPTPGGDVHNGNVDFTGSFSCGTSRLVIVGQNTYGTTRLILEVTRAGGYCGAPEVQHVLNVRLVWDVAADLDLHLVRPGGALGSSTTDCYYVTCKASGNAFGTSALDWGLVSYALDNPLLDVDDTNGLGPENIWLVNPAPGIYSVHVEYYSSGGGITALPLVEIFYDDKFVEGANSAALLSSGQTWYAFDITVGTAGVSATLRDTISP